MSRKVEFEVQCPECEWFFRGTGKGSRGDERAWRNAADKYLLHRQNDGPIIDTSTPEGLQTAAAIVIQLVNRTVKP